MLSKKRTNAGIASKKSLKLNFKYKKHAPKASSKRKRFSGPVQLLQISVFKILKNASGTEKNQIQKRNVSPRVMYFGIYLQRSLKTSKAEVFPRDDAFSKSEHALSGSPSFENAYALS